MTDVEHPDAPLSPTARSTIRRGKQRAATERATLYEVLDAGLLCHLGVSTDSGPLILPTCYGRDGNTLYLHGSTGAASLRRLAAGAPACVTVTHLDGIVYARSVFHLSANYRSAVIQGQAVVVQDEDERLHGLRVMTENLAPGSWQGSRQPTAREMAATIVLAMDLHEASVKVRTGPPVDDDEDVAAGEHWAGVLPLHQVWGTPQPCPLLPSDTVVPEWVSQR